MIGEAEIIVGAEIDHLAPAGDADAPALRAFDQPLALVEAVGVDRGERRRADVARKASDMERVSYRMSQGKSKRNEDRRQPPR